MGQPAYTHSSQREITPQHHGRTQAGRKGVAEGRTGSTQSHLLPVSLLLNEVTAQNPMKAMHGCDGARQRVCVRPYVWVCLHVYVDLFIDILFISEAVHAWFRSSVLRGNVSFDFAL